MLQTDGQTDGRHARSIGARRYNPFTAQARDFISDLEFSYRACLRRDHIFVPGCMHLLLINCVMTFSEARFCHICCRILQSQSLKHGTAPCQRLFVGC